MKRRLEETRKKESSDYFINLHTSMHSPISIYSSCCLISFAAFTHIQC